MPKPKQPLVVRYHAEPVAVVVSPQNTLISSKVVKRRDNGDLRVRGQVIYTNHDNRPTKVVTPGFTASQARQMAISLWQCANIIEMLPSEKSVIATLNEQSASLKL